MGKRRKCFFFEGIFDRNWLLGSIMTSEFIDRGDGTVTIAVARAIVLIHGKKFPCFKIKI
jgi:hypothetical protein